MWFGLIRFTFLACTTSISGHKEVVKVYLDHGLANIKDKEERTPLMWSVARGDTDMIDILCNDKACNTNDEDEAGYTALHIAGNE